MRGRKPKPTAIKRAAGNPGKRKLNDREPKLPNGVGDPPEQLDEMAAKEWKRLVRLFKPHGLLKQTDRGVLALYCSAVSSWYRAKEGITKEGGEVLSDADGDLYVNPWVRILNQAATEVARFGAMLGLDPSTRSRLVAEVGEFEATKPKVLTRPKTKLDRLPIPPPTAPTP